MTEPNIDRHEIASKPHRTTLDSKSNKKKDIGKPQTKEIRSLPSC